MTVYRRLARSKKGMSTIFGGLFFVILILMGFNVMLWGFVQFDAYNHVITSMSQRDQQAISENIVPVNATCDSSCKAGAGTLYVWVNNLGGSSVYIANVYLFNVNGSGICQPTPCIRGAVGGSANIPAGSVNFPVKISGIAIGGYSFHIILASSRGRLFSLYYPWRFNSLTINNNGNGGNFVTNIGPLAIYFDSKSFNYTQGTQTQSQSAFCMPSANSIFFIRVANTGSSPVTLLPQTAMKLELYGSNSPGLNVLAFIADNSTVNPSTPVNNAYTLANPYTIPPAPVTGPTQANFAVIKFGPPAEGSSGSVSFGPKSGNYLTFIGIYYMYQGQPQGQTIPFMDFDNAQSGSNPTCQS